MIGTNEVALDHNVFALDFAEEVQAYFGRVLGQVSTMKAGMTMLELPALLKTVQIAGFDQGADGKADLVNRLRSAWHSLHQGWGNVTAAAPASFGDDPEWLRFINQTVANNYYGKKMGKDLKVLMLNMRYAMVLGNPVMDVERFKVL